MLRTLSNYGMFLFGLSVLFSFVLLILAWVKGAY